MNGWVNTLVDVRDEIISEHDALYSLIEEIKNPSDEVLDKEEWMSEAIDHLSKAIEYLEEI